MPNSLQKFQIKIRSHDHLGREAAIIKQKRTQQFNRRFNHRLSRYLYLLKRTMQSKASQEKPWFQQSHKTTQFNF